MCICDYEQPAFYTATQRKARKQHRCEECGNAILAGESYEHVTGKWDGQLSTFKTCQRCQQVREAMFLYTECQCHEHGNLLDEAREALIEIGPETGWFCLARRLALAKRKHTTAQEATCTKLTSKTYPL